MRVSEPVSEDSVSTSDRSNDEDSATTSEKNSQLSGPEGSSDSELQDDQESDITIEQLLQQKQQGLLPSHTLKASSLTSKTSDSRTTAAKRDFKRQNKNRPVEQSSKRPVPRHRQIVEMQSSKSRDPRFENLSGNFNTNQFRKQFAFVYDEALPQEKQDLKRQLQRSKDPETREELQTQLSRIEQQIKEEQRRRQQQDVLKEHKAEERAAVKQGKKPYFLKRSDAKRQQLIAKYKQLKATGGLDKALQKRRRKNAMKDHRYVPATRGSQ